MDGAKKSKYDMFVICGVLLILLGAGTTGFRFPMLQSSGAQQHKCEVCGKVAVTSVEFESGIHFVCQEHALPDPPVNSSDEQTDPFGSDASDEAVRVIDGINVFGSGLTGADIENIRKAIAELARTQPDPNEVLPQETNLERSARRILVIRQRAENAAHIYTGELPGPHEGGGQFFQMRKEKENWIIIKTRAWATGPAQPGPAEPVHARRSWVENR